MEQPLDELTSDALIDDRLAADDAANEADEGEPYIPDPRSVWGAEAARALLVVLGRRLGPDFAQEVSDELAARRLGYGAGCPDDRRDGQVLEQLVCSPLWDALLAPPAGRA